MKRAGLTKMSSFLSETVEDRESRSVTHLENDYRRRMTKYGIVGNTQPNMELFT